MHIRLWRRACIAADNRSSTLTIADFANCFSGMLHTHQAGQQPLWSWNYAFIHATVYLCAHSLSQFNQPSSTHASLHRPLTQLSSTHLAVPPFIHSFIQMLSCWTCRQSCWRLWPAKGRQPGSCRRLARPLTVSGRAWSSRCAAAGRRAQCASTPSRTPSGSWATAATCTRYRVFLLSQTTHVQAMQLYIRPADDDDGDDDNRYCVACRCPTCVSLLLTQFVHMICLVYNTLYNITHT